MNNEEFQLPPIRPWQDGTIAILHPVQYEILIGEGSYTDFPMRLYEHRDRLGSKVIAYSGFIVFGDAEYHIIFVKNPHHLPFDELKVAIEARLDELDRRCRAERAIDMAFGDLWEGYYGAESDEEE